MTFQAKLTTKLDKFCVGNPVLELKNQVDKEHLTYILKTLLAKNDKLDESIEFDFIVGGRLLQLTVDRHLELYSDEIDAQSILNEKLVDIEYVISLNAPAPKEAVPHNDWVSSIDANETHILSGSYDNSLKIFSIKDRKCLVTIETAHDKPITKVQWVRNLSGLQKGELCFVSCGHDESAILRKFNTKNNQVTTVFNFKGHNRSINCVDCNDDVIATGSYDNTLRLWSASMSSSEPSIEDEVPKAEAEVVRKKQKLDTDSPTTKRPIMTLTGHQESLTGVRWLSGCNEYNSLATSSLDKTICFWDVEVGECKRRVLSAKPLLSIDYSGHHNLMIAGSCDRHIRMWDARAPDNATAKTAYTSHNAWVSSVAFGQSSYNFISGGYDNLVKLWDLRSTKACLYDLIGHHDKVLDVNWRNPRYLLSGSADGTLKVFASNKSD